MNIFSVNNQIICDYKSYINGFLFIKDEKELEEGLLWLEPLIQFNPIFENGTSIEQLARNQIIDQTLNNHFKCFDLYHQQVKSIKIIKDNFQSPFDKKRLKIVNVLQ